MGVRGHAGTLSLATGDCGGGLGRGRGPPAMGVGDSGRLMYGSGLLVVKPLLLLGLSAPRC